MDEFQKYFIPLILTIVFEILAGVIIGIRNKKDCLLILLANIITNPLLVHICLLMMYYIGISRAYLITYLFLEPVVIIVEYLIYKKFMMENRNYLYLSIFLNVTSIIGGYLCQRII